MGGEGEKIECVYDTTIALSRVLFLCVCIERVKKS